MNITLFGELFLNLENLHKIRWENPSLFEQVGKDLLKGANSCQIKITLEPVKELKTNSQLKLYKGVLLKYINNWMREQGNDFSIYETDTYLRSLLCFEIIEVEGEKFKIPKDLATISKEDL